MSKLVTKTVIEEIAYELKRVGLDVHAYNNGSLSEERNEELKEDGLDLSDPEFVLDWVIDNIHEVFAEHDPTFDSDRYYQQTTYKA